MNSNSKPPRTHELEKHLNSSIINLDSNMLSGAKVQTMSQDNSISSRESPAINKSGLIEEPVPLINSARSKTNQTDGKKSGQKRSRKTLIPPAVIEGSPKP